MTRSAVNFLVDAVVAALFVSLLATVSIVHFVFPPPANAAGWELWGADFETWFLIEAVAAAVFSVAVLVHVIYHWTWVCGFVTARLSAWSGRRIVLTQSSRTLYGVSLFVTVLVLLGALLTAANFAIRTP